MNIQQTLLVIIGAVALLGIGYIIGVNTSSLPAALPTAQERGTASPEGTAVDNSETQAAATGSEGTTLDTSDLSEGQRAMLEAVGIDASSITITPEMEACAEAAVGAERLAEIKAGATPSFSEGAQLLGCYEQ